MNNMSSSRINEDGAGSVSMRKLLPSFRNLKAALIIHHECPSSLLLTKSALRSPTTIYNFMLQ